MGRAKELCLLPANGSILIVYSLSISRSLSLFFIIIIDLFIIIIVISHILPRKLLSYATLCLEESHLQLNPVRSLNWEILMFICQAASVPASRPCIWIKWIRWEMGEFYELFAQVLLATFDLLILLWFYGVRKLCAQKHNIFSNNSWLSIGKHGVFLFSQTCFVLVNSEQKMEEEDLVGRKGIGIPNVLKIVNFFQCICDKRPVCCEKDRKGHFLKYVDLGPKKEET